MRVVGIDRFAPGHDRGSSYGETRLIRQAYFEHPDYVPLIKRAYSLWADLDAESGRTLYHETGILQVGPRDGLLIPGVLRSAREHNLSVEPMTSTKVESRFPGFRAREPLEAVFEPRSGYLNVEDCVQACAAAARKVGAMLRVGEAVQSWTTTTQGVEIITDKERYSARAAVVSAGAWAGQSLADLRIPFEVVRGVRRPPRTDRAQLAQRRCLVARQH